MNLIKRYKAVLAVVIPILILVLFRSFGTGYFKNDAKKWAGPSLSGSNIIALDKRDTVSGKKLIVCLNGKADIIKDQGAEFLYLPEGEILDKRNIEIIRKHDGAVLLFSEDPAVSARIWMVLSQMGLKNIFILTGFPDNETGKHKFRPDTLVRPEL